MIVTGQHVPDDAALNGKSVWLGDVQQAVSEPEQFLNRAKAEAKPWQARAAAPAATPATASANGPKRVVAVTACPTGVAHTFMAAEAIQAGSDQTRLVGKKLKPVALLVQVTRLRQKKWRRPIW